MKSRQKAKEIMNAQLFYHFYNFFKRLDPAAGQIVWLSGAFTVQLSQEGHSCLPLSEYANKKLFEDTADINITNALMPGLGEWRELLLASKLLGTSKDVVTPLTLDDGNRLYMSRNYDYETRLASQILQRVSRNGYSASEIKPALSLLFDGENGDEADWQKVAVAAAALKKICVISGGPGTGKTFTVVKIISLLQMLEPGKSVRFGLAAPTGKAAGRLHESIQESIQKIPPDIVSNLTVMPEAQTIHRLLGTKRYSPYFKHDKDNPLNLDVLIVDEVSMVDLAMMVKLLEAMPENGRVVLLGDKDQLSSVEAGRVLADICEGDTNRFSPGFAELLLRSAAVSANTLLVDSAAAAIGDCRVVLEKSYRFTAQSLIGRLARTVLAGRVAEATTILAEMNTIVEIERLDDEQADLDAQICAGFATYLKEKNPVSALKLLKGFRLLSAHRHGARGVEQLNQWVESVLVEKKMIVKQGEWYVGRPIMITGNHYAMDLFNGDVGLTLKDDQGRLRVWFETDSQQVRSFSPARIPAHETAYALTVHKSQGSEFDHVVLVLPEQSSRLITRELLYTAITRAKKRFALWGDIDVFKDGVKKITQRNTGLAEKLLRMQ